MTDEDIRRRYRDYLAEVQEHQQNFMDFSIIVCSTAMIILLTVFPLDVTFTRGVSPLVFWSISIVSVVASFFAAAQGNRAAINHVDAGKQDDFGGNWRYVMGLFDSVSLAAFVAAFLVYVVYLCMAGA